MRTVIEKLKEMLNLNIAQNEKKGLAGILLKCYLHEILTQMPGPKNDSEFKNFLRYLPPPPLNQYLVSLGEATGMPLSVQPSNFWELTVQTVGS